MDDKQPATQIPGLRIESLSALPFLTIVAWIAALLIGVPGPLIRLGFLGILALVGYVVWHQRAYVRHMLGRFAVYTRLIAMLPYYLGVMIPQILLMLLTSFVLEPFIALLWRTRRYLADATAVQLTRNPDGLASGLNSLVERGGLIPGGQWAAPLFVVGPEQTTKRAMEQHREAILTRADERGGTGPSRMLNEALAVAEVGVPPIETATGGTMGGGNASVGSFHPPLARRLKRLRTMGATITDHEEGDGRSPIGGPLGRVLAVLLVPLLLLLAVLMTVLLVLLTALSLAFSGVLMLIVYGVMSLIVG